MHKLVELFCDVDDFCAVFIPESEKMRLTDGTRKRQGAGRMTMSEVMTSSFFFRCPITETSKTSTSAIWLISTNLLSQFIQLYPLS